MQAVVLANPGEERPFMFEERPTPTPGAAEVVVRLHAASLNYRDLWLSRNRLASGWRPFIPGSDGSGVVSAVGAEVTGWRPGDEVVLNPLYVCGHCPACLSRRECSCERLTALGSRTIDGTLAEYIRVPVRNLARKPSHLSHLEAAALPMAFGTAWRALMSRGRLVPGETVLIHGVGGGVAMAAMQIAVASGARVLVTSSSGEKVDQALKLGASAGINYHREDILERVQELTDGQGVDLVVDGVGRETLSVSLQAARPEGRVVFFGSVSGTGSVDPRSVWQKEISLIGVGMPLQDEFEAAMMFVASSAIHPVISSVHARTEAEAAFAELAGPGKFGKVCIGLA